MIKVKHVTDDPQLDQVYAIRKKVFVEEQNVEPEDEFDQFEETSRHFLAYYDDIPCGTARWRFTSNGIKLERFAVLEQYRGHMVGHHLVEAVIRDIMDHPESKGKQLYLHAQLPAVSLYSRFGFTKEGEQFEECDIMHYKMIKPAF
ncbi:GNAT family N-acetyltransferase [Marinigracilibium pacificum]|uniref:GNAT family N-acetyltransferase n=1 Tax=Marinigracilibium pacificum TaxID=2729599 RepID=A0A848J3A9_9BACT|nr:GNAT family N-acetyltransferase [Marinigracilibium pacificum]NMM49020.1 GNAT family N-acetyltransferase [Marinigracilibium pacificum]